MALHSHFVPHWRDSKSNKIRTTEKNYENWARAWRDVFFIPRNRPTSRISGFSYYFLVLVPQNLSQELFCNTVYHFIRHAVDLCVMIDSLRRFGCCRYPTNLILWQRHIIIL